MERTMKTKKDEMMRKSAPCMPVPFIFPSLCCFGEEKRKKATDKKVREPNEGGILLSSPNHLPPSYLFLSVVCSSVLIFRREFLLPLRCLSFVIHKRNEEETRPSSPCSFSLHSASLHLNAFFTHALIFMSTGRLSLFFFLPSGTPPWEILSRDPHLFLRFGPCPTLRSFPHPSDIRFRRMREGGERGEEGTSSPSPIFTSLSSSSAGLELSLGPSVSLSFPSLLILVLSLLPFPSWFPLFLQARKSMK